MAKLNLASQIKQALNDVRVFKTHPLKDADLEDKMNYLKVLSFTILADDKITAEEKEYFAIVIRTLINDDMLQELLDYASNPDFSELAAITATLAKNANYKTCLLLDAAMLAYADGDFSSDEDELIRQLREIIGLDHNQFNKAYDVAKKIAKGKTEGELTRWLLEIPKGLVTHILEYKEIATVSANKQGWGETDKQGWGDTGKKIVVPIDDYWDDYWDDNYDFK